MLSDGDIIQISQQNATVCFNTTYNNLNYICVAFDQKPIRYEIYEYKYENERLLVGKVEDSEELRPVLQRFIVQGLNTNELSDEVLELLDKCLDSISSI